MPKNDNDKQANYFAHNLRLLMEQYHFKNVALAKRLHVSKSTISNYLAGTSKPPIDKLIELSYLFCCPLDTMVKLPMGITLQEDPSPTFQMIPLFHTQLNDYGDDIYIPENFDSSFFFPIPIREKSRCYAVRTKENDTIKADNILKHSYVIFSRDDTSPKDGDIVAVYLKGKGRVVIRRLYFNKNESLILKSDKEEMVIPISEKEKKIDILGKVIYKISAI